jgi:hypothetical protein
MNSKVIVAVAAISVVGAFVVGRVTTPVERLGNQGAIPAGSYYLTNHDGIFACDKPATFRVVEVTDDQRVFKTLPGRYHMARE